MPRTAQLEFFGNTSYAELFDASVQRLRELGGEPHEVDIEPLLETARLLYEGPWVAERYLATESLLAARPEAMLDVTRQIISGGANPKALDAFRAQISSEGSHPAGATHLGDRTAAAAADRGHSLPQLPTSRPDPIRLEQHAGSLHQFRESHGSRGRRGPCVPRAAQLEFFGNAAYAKLFDASVQRLRDLGGEACEVDIDPLLSAARLLYEGPWVAERYLATESLLTSKPDAMLEVTRQIIAGGANPKALDAFRAQYRLKELTRAAQPIWQAADVLLLPTAGTHYRIADEQADPIRLNSTLGATRIS